MEKYKIRQSIFTAFLAVAISIGFQKMITSDLTQYQKSCLFMLIWLCLNKIFND